MNQLEFLVSMLDLKFESFPTASSLILIVAIRLGIDMHCYYLKLFTNFYDLLTPNKLSIRFIMLPS